ncbi:CHAD domain-containing protein [bacterium]|nr:CHAD domain-containing protein [bacterium]
MAKRWEELTGQVERKLAVRFVLASRLAKLRSHVEKLFKEKGDVASETIHQVRVFCRRVQSALDVLHEDVPAKHVRKLTKTLKKLRQCAGRVRNSDVLAGELSNIRDQAPSQETCAIDWVLDRHRPSRAQGVEKLHKQVRRMEERSFWAWVDKHYSLEKSSRQLRDAKPTEMSLAALAGEKMVLEIDIFERASRSYRQGDVEQLHLLRLAVKRLRYVLEIFAGCFGPTFRPAIYQPICRCQELLGFVNDAHEFALQFDELARQSKDPNVARSFIALRDRYARLLEVAVQQFGEQWNRDEQERVLQQIRDVLGISSTRESTGPAPPIGTGTP